jgi:hypothetical protein
MSNSSPESDKQENKQFFSWDKFVKNISIGMFGMFTGVNGLSALDMYLKHQEPEKIFPVLTLFIGSSMVTGLLSYWFAKPDSQVKPS